MFGWMMCKSICKAAVNIAFLIFTAYFAITFGLHFLWFTAVPIFSHLFTQDYFMPMSKDDIYSQSNGADEDDIK